MSFLYSIRYGLFSLIVSPTSSLPAAKQLPCFDLVSLSTTGKQNAVHNEVRNRFLQYHAVGEMTVDSGPFKNEWVVPLILVFDHMTKTRFSNVFIMILDWQEHEVLSIISERTNICEGQGHSNEGLRYFFIRP